METKGNQTEIPREKLFLSIKETAKCLHICLATLDKQDIPYSKIGRRVLYNIKDIENFVLERRKSVK